MKLAIDTTQLCQGTYRQADGKMCVMGHVLNAKQMLLGYGNEYFPAPGALDEYADVPLMQVLDANDAQNFPEVTRLFALGGHEVTFFTPDSGGAHG